MDTIRERAKRGKAPTHLVSTQADGWTACSLQLSDPVRGYNKVTCGNCRRTPHFQKAFPAMYLIHALQERVTAIAKDIESLRRFFEN